MLDGENSFNTPHPGQPRVVMPYELVRTQLQRLWGGHAFGMHLALNL